MIIINNLQKKFFLTFLIVVAAQIQGAHQKYDGLPAPYYQPDNEKALAEIAFRDIVDFDVKNATKENVTLVIKHGYKLPAKHWSVFYDSLMYYAQEGVHLPPLGDFSKDRQAMIKNNWINAQKLRAHLMDCQGIYYLIKDKKLPVAAEQWPISKHDFLFFFKHNIELPPLEDFTVERQKKIRDLLKELGMNAPKISKPKPKMPILADTPITKSHTPTGLGSAAEPAFKPQAQVHAQPSPLATYKPHSSHYQEAQVEILPELSDITWNSLGMGVNFQPTSNNNPSYAHTQLFHQVQQLPQSTAENYQPHSSTASNFFEPQVLTSSSVPVRMQQNDLPSQPASSLNWNIWGYTTPTSAETHQSDLLLGDTVNLVSPQQDLLLPGSSKDEAILIASPSIYTENTGGPIDIIDLTLPLTAHTPSPAQPVLTPDEELMARFLSLSQPSSIVDSFVAASSDDAYEKGMRERLNKLGLDDAPNEDDQLATRLKALGITEEKRDKKVRQLAYENQ